eukprot:8395703-Alexandrium_andersonii.AAC.1
MRASGTPTPSCLPPRQLTILASRGTVLHYVPCSHVDAGPWATAENGVVARQYVHPASLAS